MVRAFRQLLPYLRPARRQLVIGFICILCATTVSLASPLVLKFVIDDLTGRTGGFTRTTLGGYALLLLGLAVGDGWFRYLMRQRIIGASRDIEYRLRNDFFAHLERLPLDYYQTKRTGDLMSRATNDLNAVRMMVGPAVMYFASTALGFVLAVVLMLRIDTRLTLLALLPLPGVTLAARYFGQAIHDRFDRIQSQLSEMSAVVQEALAGVRVVRAYRQEAGEIERFRAANDVYVDRNRRLIRLQSAFYPSLTLCFGLSTLTVLWVGGRDVIDGRLTLGGFVAFGRYLVMLSWPMIAFGWVINIVQRGVASWERMREVLDVVTEAEKTEVRLKPDATSVGALPVVASGSYVASGFSRTSIEFRHLTFRYSGATVDALHDVSFRVAPGQTVAIVGPTGSGKSTLLSLLPRLHNPPAGSVFVDGIDVLEWPLAELRHSIGVVPQEPFLFSDTVGGNIGFGLDEAPTTAGARALVDRSAALAGLAAEIAEFPLGYDTRVGERGITLSGGQKQRAAIARALAVEPRILLLDDALSSVDTGTEEAILRQLTHVRRDRTCLIVAHRVSTVRDADLILVLREGRVVEQGTHDELVSRGGVYADMHRRQLLEEEIARA